MYVVKNKRILESSLACMENVIGYKYFAYSCILNKPTKPSKGYIHAIVSDLWFEDEKGIKELNCSEV